MFSINCENEITLTRGDTLIANLDIFQGNGLPFEIEEGDTLRFVLKRKATDLTPLLSIDIPTDTMDLVIPPDATKPLRFLTYYYDISMLRANGEVYTFIPYAKFTIAEEIG